MKPGQAYTKTWRFKNSGTLPWGQGVRFVFIDETIDGIKSEKMGAPDYVDVANVKPGDTVDVSVNFKAPDQPGKYRSYWRFKLGDGTWMRRPTFSEIFVASTADVPAGQQGVRITQAGQTMTLPCGSPIPPGWSCTCNCVTGCSCVGNVPLTTHYWYPN